MRRIGTTTTACALITLTGLGASALAQVAPPPPGPPAERPVFEPEPEVRRPAANPQPTRQRAQPRAQGFDPREIEHESLELFDEDGRLIPLGIPTEMAALDRNPILDERSRARVDALLAERLATLEHAVIEHADAAFELDHGVLKDLVIEDRDRLEVIRELLRPLSVRTPLAEAMFEGGAMSAEQTAMNDFITQGYRMRQIEQARNDAIVAGDTAPANAILRTALAQQAEEAMFVYHRLMIEAAGLGEGMLEGLANVPSEVRAAARRAAQAEGNDAKLAAVRQILRQLPASQHGAVLSNARQARGR